MRKIVLALSAAAAVVPATVLTTAPADAQRHHSRYARYYDRHGYYNGPAWRGRDGRYYCRRSNGTTGLLIGGAAGAFPPLSANAPSDLKSPSPSADKEQVTPPPGERPR